MEALMRHEGKRLWPYDDATGKEVKAPKGHLTIGYGRNLTANGISEEEAKRMLRADVIHAWTDAMRLVPSFVELDDERKAVLINMAFNLGRTRLSRFRKMLVAIERKDFGLAAHEMLDSRWAKQVPSRAAELAHKMRGGNA